MSESLKRFSLKGKTALVTGASRGLGKAIALGFAEAGANLVLVSRAAKDLSDVATEVHRRDKVAHVFPFDLLETDQIPALFDRILAEAGRVDILANIAGMIHRAPAVDFPIQEWRKVLELNTTATFILSQQFARSCIIKKHSGKIINIASLLSEATRPGIPAYVASKGAIRQLTKALAVEWAQNGINVNGIGPGYFETEITKPLQANIEFNQWVLESTPLRRWGQPDDLVGAAIFLASSASDFITGQIIYVDGGWLAGL
jgi:gluconate 5-dehydrogenase